MGELAGNAQTAEWIPARLAIPAVPATPAVPASSGKDPLTRTNAPPEADVTFVPGMGITDPALPADLDVTSFQPPPDSEATTFESPESPKRAVSPTSGVTRSAAARAREGPLEDETVFLQPSPDSEVTTFEPPQTRRSTSGVRRSAAARAGEGPLELGQAFGTRYHIIRLLGVGGMGAVYQAWDAELGVAVALKVIRPEVAADPAAAREIERRFKRELLLARQVTHKNVVRIHDLGEIDGIKYITMPYVEGVGSRDDPQAGDEAAGPASAAHRARHRRPGSSPRTTPASSTAISSRPTSWSTPTTTPSSWTSGSRARAGRGGQGPRVRASVGPGRSEPHCRASAGGTMAGAIIGTIEYMAPEQAKGQPVDQRADIYALGLILYDMLHRRADASERRRQRDRGAAGRGWSRRRPRLRTIDPEIPPAVERSSSRCLEPDAGEALPDDRRAGRSSIGSTTTASRCPIMRRVVEAADGCGGGRIAAAAARAAPGGTPDLDLRRRSARPGHGGDRGLSEQHQRSDVRPHARADAQARAGRCRASSARTTGRRIRRRSACSRPRQLDEAAARELALKQGVGVVLSGSIDRRGNGYEISIKAVRDRDRQRDHQRQRSSRRARTRSWKSRRGW